jgi:hypothetical protein
VAETSACNGLASITVSGGTSPYTYSWTTGGQTTDTIKNQCSGTYCCDITDNNGCTTTTCVTVINNLSTGTTDLMTNIADLKVYPNPTNGNFSIEGILQGQTIELYNYLGQEVIHMLASDNKTTHFEISDKTNGAYLLRILNRDGNIAVQKKIVKTQ